MKSVPTAWRWAFVVLITVVALAVAVWPRDEHGASSVTATAVQDGPAAVSDDQRAAAALADCPRPSARTEPAPDAGPLAGMVVQCLADGRPIDLGAALAGRPALLNLWAFYCEPCAQELPALQEYANRAGDAVTVLTVHSDPAQTRGLDRLRALGVHLPGVQDGDGKVRSVSNAPRVLPISILVRADGSIAKVLVQPFKSADEVAAAVEQGLGVAA
ncbi:TlpA disulfide reductase family protein [Nocardia sp. NPDC052254]|uniref:TlpA family protein disulfide reductase n=1 Tax=Nocardia sp. NPDC052254 TaxID=3155681 RepID=UPI00341E34A6